jgi:hypothetical protein
VTSDAEQIIAKLTARELDYLEDTFGLNLRDADRLEVLETLSETRRRIRTIEEKAIRRRREKNGERPTCSFCGGMPETVGLLCQSSLGPYICGACAQAVVERIDVEKQRDA